MKTLFKIVGCFIAYLVIAGTIVQVNETLGMILFAPLMFIALGLFLLITPFGWVFMLIFGETVLDNLKWIGLGGMVTNVANNKINADAEVKLGRPRTKNSIKTGNQFVDGMMEFASPSTDVTVNKDEDDDYQEYLKWKAEKERAKEYEEFLKWQKSKEDNVDDF